MLDNEIVVRAIMALLGAVVFAGGKGLLGILKAYARRTPTPIDDAIVERTEDAFDNAFGKRDDGKGNE